MAAHTASHGWPGHTIRLALTLHRYLDGVPDTAGLAICRHALAAARRLRRPRRPGAHAHHPGRHLRPAGPATRRPPTATSEAIALAREAGDRLTQVWALGNLALIHDQQGRYPQAARCNRQAIALYAANWGT